jgi:membrane protease YdiL (CAAX protease family)
MMSRPITASDTATDCVVVSAICFGWFILVSAQSVASAFPSEPFTDASLLDLMAREAVFAAGAIGYLHARGYKVAQLMPAPTSVGTLSGLGLYVATVFISWPIVVAVSAAFHAPQPIEDMVADARLSIVPIVAMSIVNGIYEEVFLLGYLQRALEKSGVVFAISASLLVRVAYHLYQGPSGVAYVLVFGLVLSAYFAWRRELWPAISAHIFADIVGLAQ